MIDRAHGQVIRHQNQFFYERRHDIPIDLSSRFPPDVIKVSRCYRHQSLNNQNNHHNDIKRKIISLPNNIYSINPQTIDINDSVSIIFLDSNDTNDLKQISKRTIKPSVNNKRNDLYLPTLSQFIESWSEEKISTNQFDEKYRNKKKRRFLENYCICSPLCKFLLLIGFIFLGTIIIGIPIVLSTSKKSMSTISNTQISIIITTTTTSTSTSTTSLSTTTTTTTVTSTSTTTTAIPCIPSCNVEQICVEGICVNVGNLACTLTWSRPGDGDIDVTTPNNHTIYYKNRGPSSSTDGGQLDRDDQVNTGPENVYWAINSTIPPNGTYYVCFEPYSISPNISITDPITVIYRIVGPSGIIAIFIRTFTSVLKNSYICNVDSPTLVGSFTYP